MKRIVLIFLLLFILFSTISSFAGQYELIKGEGVEVCEAYLKNLNSFGGYGPLDCNRPINPKLKSELSDFEKPVWEKIDLEKNRELFRRLVQYANRGDQLGKEYYDDEKVLQRMIQSQKERKYNYIKITKIDLNNDGSEEDVLRYEDRCMGPGPFGTDIYVLSKDMCVIDEAHPAQKLITAKIKTDLSPTYVTVDIFKYKNITYVDKYCPYERKAMNCDEKNTLTVYKMSNDKIDETCKYRFKF